jgi:hypothetical protein
LDTIAMDADFLKHVIGIVEIIKTDENKNFYVKIERQEKEKKYGNKNNFCIAIVWIMYGVV